MSQDFYQEAADKFIFNVKKNLLYTEDDIWVKIENGKAQIGLTDFLQRQAGDVVFAELPEKGMAVSRGMEIFSFETIKSVITIASPFDGVIAGINGALADKPELINSDPYGDGWIAQIAPSNLEEEKKRLMSAEKYFELMKSKIKIRLENRKGQ